MGPAAMITIGLIGAGTLAFWVHAWREGGRVRARGRRNRQAVVDRPADHDLAGVVGDAAELAVGSAAFVDVTDASVGIDCVGGFDGGGGCDGGSD